MKAIIVEDTYEYFLAISDILVGIGFKEPRRFESVNEFLKTQCKEKVDLVLLDYELIKNLQRNELANVFQTCRSRTLIMVGSNDIDSIDELYSLGMIDYFIKNNPPAKIRNRILDVLDMNIGIGG